MERFNRAARRAQVARLKVKRRNYWGYGRPWNNHEAMSPQQLGRVVQNPQTCSCMGCGNGRRWFGKSLTEIRDLVALEEALSEQRGQTDVGVPHRPKQLYK